MSSAPDGHTDAVHGPRTVLDMAGFDDPDLTDPDLIDPDLTDPDLTGGPDAPGDGTGQQPGKKKGTKSRKKSDKAAGSGGSGGSVPAVPVVRVVPIATNFDFLEGGFKRTERTRRTLLGVAIAALAVLAALGLLGVHSLVQRGLAEQALARISAEDATARGELARVDVAGGVSAEQLRLHNQRRQGSLVTAAGTEIDTATLLETVTSTLPAGVTLTGLTVSSPPPLSAPAAPAAGGDEGDEAAEADGAAEEGSDAAPSAAPAAPAPERTVTMTGTTTGFDQIGVWESAVRSSPQFADVTPTWTGGGDTLTVTISATITEAAESERSRQVRASDPYGLTEVTP